MDYTDFKVLGKTRDDAAGECYDKVARLLGMPYPGGVYLDKKAREGDPDAYHLPHPRVDGSRYDFSFSGLKTAVINLLHNAEQKGETVNTADLCASFQKTAVDVLVENTLLAAKDCKAGKVVLAAGFPPIPRCASGWRRWQAGVQLYYPPCHLFGQRGDGGLASLL